MSEVDNLEGVPTPPDTSSTKFNTHPREIPKFVAPSSYLRTRSVPRPKLPSAPVLQPLNAVDHEQIEGLVRFSLMHPHLSSWGLLRLFLVLTLVPFAACYSRIPQGPH